MFADLFHLWIRSLFVVALVTSLGWLPAQVDEPQDFQDTTVSVQDQSTSDKTAALDPNGNT